MLKQRLSRGKSGEDDDDELSESKPGVLGAREGSAGARSNLTSEVGGEQRSDMWPVSACQYEARLWCRACCTSAMPISSNVRSFPILGACGPQLLLL